MTSTLTISRLTKRFGDVEALVQFQRACSIGPRFANVVAVYDLPASGEPAPTGFERRATV